MRIAIVGDSRRRHKDEPLIEEAKAKFDEVVYAPIDQIRFDISKKHKTKGFSVNFEGKDLSGFDYVLPIPTKRHSELFYTLLWMLESENTPFTADQYLMFMNNGLLRNHMRKKGIRMRNFVSVASNVPLDGIKNGFKFPLIVRPPKKRVVVNNSKTLKDVLSLYKFGTSILIERPVKTDMDMWMFVVGDEAIASYSKYKRKEDIETPSIAGSELSGIAVETKDAIGCDYCAIRFLLRKDKWMVDRITLSPNFENFQEQTGVNVARHVISNLSKPKKKKEPNMLERIEGYLKVNFPQILKVGK